MQTRLAPHIKETATGKEADAILRKCVHCGFCTATCPTYQLLGDELDGPRGRIYLVKQMLEGETVTQTTQRHLDRCLSCRACETTCPSGVRYGRLADIGREMIEERVKRTPDQRLKRAAIRAVLPHRDRFSPLLALGRSVRGLLPERWRRRIPVARPAGQWPAIRHDRKFLALGGCVQPSLHPGIDAAAARVLDRLGVSVVPVPTTGCCGAINYHTGAHRDGLDDMRRNIDAWWPLLGDGIEGILVNASACALTVKEYGQALAHDSAYAKKATRISDLARDLSEIIAEEELAGLGEPTPAGQRIAFHSPCTLQHGQKLNGKVERILTALGFDLAPVPDAHLCCGSAGTYSIFQPVLSQQLRVQILAALEGGSPSLIATANIGCLMHLDSAASTSVVHWIELLDNLETK